MNMKHEVGPTADVFQAFRDLVREFGAVELAGQMVMNVGTLYNKMGADEDMDHGVSLQGYGFSVTGSQLVMRPYMPYKFSAVHPLKKGGSKVKASSANMVFNFCPFCGVRVNGTDAEQVPTPEATVQMFAVLSPGGAEGVFFNDKRDAHWTATGRGKAAGLFGVPTLGDAFRRAYDDTETFNQVEISVALPKAAVAVAVLEVGQ